MREFKRNCKFNNYKSLKLILTLTTFLIILFTFFLVYKFNQNVNKTLLEISETEINKLSYSFITDKINNDVLNENTLGDILIIEKNDKNEILYVDFNLDKAYKVLDNVSNILTDSFKKLENGKIEVGYIDKNFSNKTNGLILNIPIGSTLNSNFFYNFGPKIPVKINFVGSVLTNLETKITNYGLNNALVEVFVYIEFHNEIISPFKTKNLEFKYDAVIASKMINGTVPSFYNGVMEKSSSVKQDVIE